MTLLGYDDYAGSGRVALQCFSLPRPGDDRPTENLILDAEPDGTGRFTVTAPSPGSWMVELFGGETFPRVRLDLVIPPGRDPIPLEIQLPPRGVAVVEGFVLAGESPLVAGEVVIGDERGPLAEDGSFRIERVSSGEEPVAVELRTGLTYRLAPLEVPPGTARVEHEIRLGSGEIVAWIEGVPQVGDSARLFIQLEPLPADGAEEWLDDVTAELPSDRPVSVPHLRPGRYRLELSFGFKFRRFFRGELELEDGARVELPLAYREPGVCRLRISSTDGAARELPERILVESTGGGARLRESIPITDGEATLSSWIEEEIPLRVLATGFAPAEILVRFVSGEESEAELSLAPTAVPR